ncbi:MAG: DUF3536 domain-containing protein [Bryobacteraceae bacterium]
MERYICIHGHFYQPPRENPWLEAIEVQDSAHPYHDWNERITAECYAPNSAARILDANGRITKIVNNYSRISFNFGPTLLAWMAAKAPEVYQQVVRADKESAELFSGHGSALAQGYNHMIMPLANSRDRYTQIFWGIRDFVHRFGRQPEGMWLPETAVDLETLDILVELGIKFTILAPSQARRVRPVGGRVWRDVSGSRIDPSMAYLCRLGAKRSINILFYDGPISRGIAFENILARGENLADRLTGAFNGAREWSQLVHIATDGETYGHHRAHGDMALAYALEHIQSNNLAKLTNYGEYLEKHPITHQVQIFEDSSWSCVHGVERWQNNCGCNSGMNRGWNQEWRAPLREALDWLRDMLAVPFEAEGRKLFKDPFEARDNYIDVILDRSDGVLDEFFQKYAIRELDQAGRIRAIKLLEMQRHAMLMYTSCGWFFDELSGIETVQVIQYAGRALQLAKELCADSLEEEFLHRLEIAKSNIPEHKDGRVIYEKFVRPAMVDLGKVGAHYAISSLFEDYKVNARMFCYSVHREDYRVSSAGSSTLALGRATIESTITRESSTISFGVLHLGDHNVFGGIREHRGEESHKELVREVSRIFEQGQMNEWIHAVDKGFGSGTYSLRMLFRDEQRKILRRVLESHLAEAESVYRRLYNAEAYLMRFLAELGMPLPNRFKLAGEVVLNMDLQRALQTERLDLERVRALFEEAQAVQTPLDSVRLEFVLRRRLEKLIDQFQEEPGELQCLQELGRTVSLAQSLPFPVALWKPQNAFYEMLGSLFPSQSEMAAKGDEAAQAWTGEFQKVADMLGLQVPA